MLIMEWKERGKQFCGQPQFARSDHRYGSHGDQAHVLAIKEQLDM